MSSLHDAIASQRSRLVQGLQELVRLLSVSATGEGIAECAEFLRNSMETSGFEATVLPTAGHPLVFGQWPHRDGLPTLLLTSHYDVQPADPSTWKYPPYDAVLEGDRIWGRGASDAKGPVMAILKGAEILVETVGRPDINLKVLFDGEEEIGSPSMPGALDRWRELLAADGVVTLDGNSAADGRPSIGFGGGGLLYLQLDVRTAQRDLHANRGALVPNALWRLVWALAILKSPDEQVTIDGFGDHLAPITDQDRHLLESHGWDDRLELNSLGAESFLPGRGGQHGPEALHLHPIVGISGLQGGYEGEGVMTVLPAQATAKLYIGLRFAQQPEEILQKLRAHLDSRGFGDIELTVLAASEPSSSRSDSDLARLVLEEAEKLVGRSPVVTPRANWYGRQGVWIGNRIGADAAQVSIVAPPSPNNHAPDEFLILDYYLRGIEYVGRLLKAAGRLPSRRPPTTGG